MTTRLCIVRHGETDWNVEKRIQGHTDIPLNATGRAQALAMAFHIAHHPFHALYSSDLTRALVTAQAIAARIEQGIRLLPGLRERHYGDLQEHTAAEIAARDPALHALYKARDPDTRFGSGESLVEFAQRVRHTVEWIGRHHAGHAVAVVCHSGVLDILYRQATGRPLTTARDFVIPNCALNWFAVDAHGLHLQSWADRHHLQHVLTEAAE